MSAPRRKAHETERLESLVQAMNAAADEVGDDPAMACAAALTLASRYAALLGVSQDMFRRHAPRLLQEACENYGRAEEPALH